MRKFLRKPLPLLLSLQIFTGMAFPLATIAATQTIIQSELQNLPNFSRLVEESGPAVVHIRTTQKVSVSQIAAEKDELYKRYFGVPDPHKSNSDKNNPHKNDPGKNTPDKNIPDKIGPDDNEQSNTPDEDEQISRGVGSGFIFSDDGYVLTNAHVVRDADAVFVKLTDKREFSAQVLGIDVNTDVAVLKIEGEKLPKVNLGNSSDIKVGEWVIAIGSPFDLDNSISAGIISAKAREIGDFLLLIQTDVAINPGNSGGPLINLRGQVIGINSQIYSRSGGYMGISFAIPIDDAMRVAQQLKTQGRVTRGRMGVYLADINNDVAKSLKLPNSTATLVSRIEHNGPAQKAGLQDGDIILNFNETAVETSTELRRLAAAAQPGTQVKLKVWRKGIINDYTVTLAELPSQVAVAPAVNTHIDRKITSLGLDVTSIPDEQKQALGITSGVIIKRAEGRAARAGLQVDDIIVNINNQDINSDKDFKKITEKLHQTDLVLLARRENITQYIAIPAN